MAEVLIINGNDYSQYVERKGLSWSRNDLDSENTTRLKSGKMRREKITTKRKLGYTMFRMTRELLAQLDEDLNEETVEVTYADLHGTQTREFYCSSFSCSLAEVQDGEQVWEEAAFNLIEV